MIGIYAIFRKSDDKCMYVGQSNNIQKRIKEHLKYNTNTNFNVEEYYGKEIETFDFYDKENQLNREAYWINELNAECNNTRNRKLSDEHKQSVRQTLTGRKLTDEHKKHIGDSERGEKHHLYGKHRSKEVKDKISKSNTGKRYKRPKEFGEQVTLRQIGYVWINDGKINKRIYKHQLNELNTYINAGWTYGMLRRQNDKVNRHNT